MTLQEDGGAFFERLEEEGIPYMVVGAIAQANFAPPRFTTDLDIQIRLDEPVPAHRSTFLDAIIEERAHDGVFDQEVLILHLPTRSTPIELFVTSHWFTKQALERRTQAHSDVFGQMIPIPTVEDQVLLKAAYFASADRRPGKKAQDQVDLEDIIEAHRTRLDLGYLQENAVRLGVWTEIEKILDP